MGLTSATETARADLPASWFHPQDKPPRNGSDWMPSRSRGVLLPFIAAAGS